MDIQAFSDHNNYLDRMAESLAESTKSLIPLYIKGRKTILDVGCADGSMMMKIQLNDENVKIYGIDLCQESVDICKDKGLNVIKTDIDSFASNTDLRFDTIIFSSVLHEISSYANKNKYDVCHIEKALESAKRLLTDDGIIIIRDGIGTGDTRFVDFKLKNTEDTHFVKEFMELPVVHWKRWSMTIVSKDEIKVNMSTRDFKEFCFTYTWGENSWARESQEKFGILTLKEWLETVDKSGFRLKFVSTSSEQYVERLREKIECDRLEEILAESTITMILSKG